MNIEKIIKELIYNKIIPSNQTDYEQLNGGTVSQVFLLHNDRRKYIVKANDSQIIKAESHFLHTYKELNLLPKLLFVERSNRYIVYSYIDGSTQYLRKNKKEMLQELVKELINNYKLTDQEIGWGWADEPTDSWKSFLNAEIAEAYKLIGSRLSKDDYHLIHNLIKKINNDRKPFFIHGDCGVHNFIFNNGKLTGVIDPTPIIGDPMYDLIYAFCSSPEDLTRETIDAAANLMVVNNYENTYDLVIIGLYLRIGTCIKHHPDDMGAYLKAWEYWKSVTMKLER